MAVVLRSGYRRWIDGEYSYDINPYENVGNLSVDYNWTARPGRGPGYFAEGASTWLCELEGTAAGTYIGCSLARANALYLLDLMWEKKNTETLEGIYIYEEQGEAPFWELLYDIAEVKEYQKDIIDYYYKSLRSFVAHNGEYKARIEYSLANEWATQNLDKDEGESLVKYKGLIGSSSIYDVFNSLKVKHYPQSIGLAYYADRRTLLDGMKVILARERMMEIAKTN